MAKENYTTNAIERSRASAFDWLGGNKDGYPRSWEQEAVDTKKRGYELYDNDWEAPPIAGYEVLEAEGLAIRLGKITHRGEERIHFGRPKAEEQP